ncbi:MAG: SsgA family sporulation/cell division regulator [Streptosporangiales bacterium]|jgi:hypothetical protein|nr:SsgA family sporulation/cell division regulator [Streptosporangiales bacterium]
MNSGCTVSAELGLRLVVPEETVVPLVASLYYSSDDPYAVRIAFHVGMDEPVEWTFARDLLASGAEDAAGDGDVKAWPSGRSASGLTGTVLNLHLISPYGEALFEAPIREVTEFLGRTYQVVPKGGESEHLDFEKGLEELLRQAL